MSESSSPDKNVKWWQRNPMEALLNHSYVPGLEAGHGAEARNIDPYTASYRKMKGMAEILMGGNKKICIDGLILSKIKTCLRFRVENQSDTESISLRYYFEDDRLTGIGVGWGEEWVPVDLVNGKVKGALSGTVERFNELFPTAVARISNELEARLPIAK